MNPFPVYQRALALEDISAEEGLHIYENSSTSELMFVAHEMRKKIKNDNIVTWQIDRNINITNGCIALCRFCNFSRKPGDPDTYITTIEEYDKKIEELFVLGGRQILLQGGLHPSLGLDFYTSLFRKLKQRHPGLKLHALGPPEIVFLAKMEKTSVAEILTELISAGLDSLPGAGAEILSDRVRKEISPAKCSSEEWLNVMLEAHKKQLVTSATMMFGHIETKEERIGHLIKLREVQSAKPAGSQGFLAFISWPFQDNGTFLKERKNISNTVSADEYIRTVAISRIMLPAIPNIQASWLTVGKEVAQVCLHAGANDFGSIMIEENVVSAAGAKFTFDATGIQQSITEAGFVPRLRNQKYELL